VKWMSATSGIATPRRRSSAWISPRFSASRWDGAVTRAISQPARARASTWSMVAFVSRVSVVVIDWIRIGLSPPIPTLPTRTSRVLRRDQAVVPLDADAQAVARLDLGQPRPPLVQQVERDIARQGDGERAAAAADALFPRGGAIEWSGADAAIPGYVDRLVAASHPRTRILMRLLFFLVEHATLIFPAPGGVSGLRRFSSLDPERRLAVLDGWAGSRLFPRRLVFTSLRAIATFGYFAHPPVLGALHLAPWAIDPPICEADLLYPRIGARRDSIALTRDDLTDLAEYLGDKYGYRAEDAGDVSARVVELLQMLARRLHAQRDAGSRYYLGDRLSAVDIYSATFMALLQPLPKEECPMPDAMRAAFGSVEAATRDALDPILIEHRDHVYRTHLELPLTLG